MLKLRKSWMKMTMDIEFDEYTDDDEDIRKEEPLYAGNNNEQQYQPIDL